MNPYHQKTNDEIRLLAKTTLGESKMTILMMSLFPGLAVFAGNIIIMAITGTEPNVISSLLTFCLGLAVSLMTVGIMRSILRRIRNEIESVEFNDVLYGLKNQPLRFLGIMLLYQITITAGMLLLIVPGIIFAFSFSQVLYLGIDEPQTPVLDLFRKSARIMKGEKLRFFSLFIPYYLIMLAPMLVVLFSALTGSGLLTMLTTIAFPFAMLILWLILIPQIYIACTYFYESVREKI